MKQNRIYLNILFVITQFVFFNINDVKSTILTPPYFNLVTNKKAYATATCGEDINEPELFCKLTGASATDRELLSSTNLIQGQYCDFCDRNNPEKSYPAKNAIDSTDKWWQSPPLSRSLDYNMVNFTIDLGQEFHVAYIYIKMANSPRPGVWALERSTDYGKTYQPWQYFADTPSDCFNFFNTDANKRIERDDEVICSTEYSKVIPVEGGEIVVSLVNNRPNSRNFSNSDVLQKWTRATNIRLRLLRTKTLLGHLMAVARQDPSVTRRYFYSIRDISIGGRCVCNGHAQDCEATDSEDDTKLMCNCQHNTCGDQCQECCPGFVQKRWQQNRENNEFQCEPCQCHGHSETCHYDEEIDRKGLSIDIHGNYAGGGVCEDCQDNTEGINCEKCIAGYYRPLNIPINETDACHKCNCDGYFSTGNCAEETGQCECKKQFTGANCERCSDGYYDWPNCRPCDCHVEGRADDTCVPTDGSCNCKEGYKGPYCDTCVEGYYGFPNCTPCGCDNDGNLNPNCDQETGNCVCRTGYTGSKCEKCEDGYYGDETCTPCNCDGGATDEICHKNNGACICKPNFAGERCNECAYGFYNFPECSPCECDMDGSIGENCTYFNVKQCYCKEGRGGSSCDQCAPGYYQYPECIQCGCDEYGTIGQSCDPKSGKCKCKPNFVGEKCTECAPNLYNYPICEECRCHPDGVKIDFPGCSKEDRALSVICPCREHVTGRQCDQCKDRYYGLGSNITHGCSTCECSRDGTLNELDVCDKTSGQCLCKKFTGSLTCAECEAGKYALMRNEIFGCKPCECRVGSSIDNNCDKSTGACSCLPHIVGDKCDSPQTNYYTPNLHQLKFEIEDGYTPNLKAVRYGFDAEKFPNFSWKGYVNFNKLQSEVLQDVKLEKMGSYRMILHYINKNPDLSEVLIRVIPKATDGDEQNITVYLPSASKPEFATVVRNQINAVTFELENTSPYTISFKTTSDAIYLDYFVLLPSEYYEPNLLKKNIENVCENFNEDLCVHYVYPPLDGLTSQVLSDDPNFEEIRKDLESIKPNHKYKTPLYLVPIEADRTVSTDVRFSTPGKYILLIEYLNTGNDGHEVNVDIHHPEKSPKQTGKVYLYKCNITTLCRQAILSADTNEPLVVEGRDGATIKFDSVNDGVALAYRIIAVPKEKFDLNHIKMAPNCILRNGECVSIEYIKFPQLVKMELETDHENEMQDLTTSLNNRKHLKLADPNTKLVYMHDHFPEINVPIRTSRRDKGDHVMIVHYYQPNQALVNVSVFVDKSFKGSFEAPYCPSISGCRSIVKFETGETFNYEDSRNLNFQLVQNGKDIWLDYVLFAPAANVNPDLLKSEPVDFTDEFLTKCASQHFNIEPGKSQFCDDSVFALSARYNNGAVSCNCDPEGSLEVSCEAFGGQCKCKDNVIGRECSRCKTGYYGFPECKQCNCPSGNCDDKTGNCICAQNVEEDNCNKCIQGTYGFDPHFGCDDCDCNSEGTTNGNTVCNPETGQCDCKPNIDGRKCDMCKAGFYNYPQCFECSCNANGTTDRICDPNYANCLCKENVNGPSCDQCEYGTFNLESRNPKGCTKCYCFGLTDHCISSHYYFRSVKDMNEENWSLSNLKNGAIKRNENGLYFEVNNDSELEKSNEAIYWVAPAEYLGKKIYSYGGTLRYSLSFKPLDDNSDMSPQKFVRPDLIISGHNMSITYTSLHQPIPGKQYDNSVDLIESQFSHLSTGFSVSREQLMLILNSLSELKIRASYVPQIQSAELYDVQMDHGVDQYEYDDMDLSRPALSVERCNCPHLHRGLSCESCAPGYYKQKGAGIGSFTCVPCQCNGRSDICDEETGECLNCEDNTTGKNCEKCKVGYYPIAYGNNELVCRICPCPGPSEMNIFATGCMFDMNANKVYHCSCLPGYTGQFCERCAPGYYGNPSTPGGKCLPCQCNDNIDMRDFGSCDQRTGACIKCLNNTAGVNCEKCAPWSYGDPIVLKNCQPCKCDKCGSDTCDPQTGECICKANIKGFTCASCNENTWGFNQCEGCKQCNCNPIGSTSSQCNSLTGNCYCKPGIGGKFCDQCLPDFWNFTTDGCTPCYCDKLGVQSGMSGISCNEKTGDCKCIPGVKGKFCDECDDRWILVKHEGCRKCDSCVHTLLDDVESLFIKADGIENRNSSLTFKAQNKLAKLEEEFNAVKSTITPESADNTQLVQLARSIKKINDELPDVYFITSFKISDKVNSFSEIYKDAHDFNQEIHALRVKLDGINRAIEEVDRKDIYEHKNLTDADLEYYERVVDEIMNKRLNETYKEFEDILKQFHEENKTVEDLAKSYSSHAAQFETIKNKTSYLEKSLQELREYVDKAKSLEKFKDRDVTFKAYVDNLNQIKADTNEMKDKSTQIVDKVKELIKSSEENLAKSSDELKELDQSVTDINQLFANHDENFLKLREKYLKADAKASNLTLTAKIWKDKVMQSENGLTAFEMAKVYDTIAETLLAANKKSKEVLEKYENANKTLDEYLQKVTELNERNDKITASFDKERERKQESETQLDELTKQHTNLDRKLKSLNKEIEKVDQWVNRTNSNDQLLNNLNKELQMQQNEYNENEKNATEIIRRIQSLDTLKGLLPVPLPGEENDLNNNNLIAKINNSIDSLQSVNNEIDTKIEHLKKIDHEYGYELDKISEMIYNLRVLIDSTRDIANEIKVAVKFNDSSVLRVKNSPEFAPSMMSTGSLYVKTNQPYSPIALIYNENKPSTYMSLYLKDGQPHFQYKLSDTAEPTIIQTPNRIDDNKWHKLEFERVGRLAKLKVHSETEHTESSNESNDNSVVFNMDPTDTRFILGQLNFSDNNIPSELKNQLTHDGQVHNQFNGAIDTLKLNGESFGLWNYESADNIGGELKRTFDREQPNDDNAIQFNQNSFMCMKTRKKYRLQSRKPLSITVSFKTAVSNGLIWLSKEFCSKTTYCDPKKYVAVYLKDGYLNVDVDNSNAKYSLDCSKSKDSRQLNDNKFHSINVQIVYTNQDGNDVLTIKAGEVTSDFDNEQIELGNVAHELYQKLTLTLSEQCLGGIPENYRDISAATKDIKGFIGCMNLLLVSALDNDRVNLQLERLKPSTITARVGSSCSDIIDQCSFKKSTDPTYISFDILSVEDKATFGISFVPLNLNGSLLFIRQRDLQEGLAVNYIYLYFENGKLILIVKNTNKSVRLESNVPISYSELYHVYIIKDDGEFKLIVNDVSTTDTLSEKSRIYTNSDLFVGGVSLNERVGVNEPFYNYHGCIIGLIYKDKPLKFQNFKSHSQNNLVFANCYHAAAENKLENQKAALASQKIVVQHLSQQIRNKIKEEECILSKNYDQSQMKTVGIRFGLTKNSRLEVWENHDMKLTSSISFKFRTLLPEGLIFYASDILFNDFIAIWLQDGFLNYAFDCGTGLMHIKSAQIYNDGRYHTVIATRDRQTGILKTLDRTNTTVIESIEDTSIGAANSLNLNEPYYIGSIPENVLTLLPKKQSDLINTEPYIGCMSDFIIAFKQLKSHVRKSDIMNCSNNHESGIFFTAKTQTTYASLPSSLNMEDTIEIEFDMKPRAKNGVVLYIGQDDGQNRDYIILELVDGELQYRVSVGGMSNSVKYIPKYSTNELCNANWIRIRVKKDNQGRITLNVKHQDYTPEFNPEMIAFSSKRSNLYFGALPNTELYNKVSVTNEPFIGCVRDLLINQSGATKPNKSLLDLNLNENIINYCPIK